MPNIDWLALMPMLMVTGFALLTMLLSAFMEDRADRVGYFSLAGLGATALFVAWYWGQHPTLSSTSFNQMLTVDSFSLFFYLLLIMISAVSILMAIPYLQREHAQHGEFYSIVLFALVGMMVMVSSNDLITLFLGFETMSLAIYILTGWRRHIVASNEAVLKYFFLGSFAAGIFLYGIAMIYGVVGSTNLLELRSYIEATNVINQPLIIVGALMVLVGMAFKIAAFPFHMWMPDVYEGAPTPVTGFMATAVKAAAFGLVMRVFLDAFTAGALETIGYHVVWWIAIITMFVGNLFALAQKNIKRMLAFSSIAHTGYLLVAVAALPDADAASAILFYLVAYAFTNLAALACVSFLNSREERYQNIEDFAGAAWKYPLVGLGMTLAMFSLIGFPPTVGFFGKYYLFIAAIKAGFMPLVVVAIINSILSVYYYLRVVVVMFMKPETADTRGDVLSGATKVAIVYASVAILWAGIGTINLTGLLPGAAPLIESARASAQALLTPPPVPAAKK